MFVFLCARKPKKGGNFLNSEGKISAIIVTKDSAQLTLELIKSIVADKDLFSELEEIIIVDNGSKDNTEKLVKDLGLDVEYIRLEENLGFSKAVNLGAKKIKGDYILLLNSDVLLPLGEIINLKRFMEKNGDVGVCGPQLLFSDGSPQRSYSHVPSLISELFPRSLYEKIFVERKLKKLEREKNLPVFIVDSLIGACLLIRRTTFRKLNGFDERFFFFLEETDFCVRVRKIGELVVFVPYAKVIHYQGMTVKKSWILGRIEYNISLFKFIKKHHRGTYFICFAFIRFLKALGNLLVLIFLPFLLFSAKKRNLLFYYLRLLIWFLKGLPEDYGLRGYPQSNSQERI